MRVLEVVPDHVAQEGVAVAGAAAVVRLQDRVAFRGEDLHVVAPASEAEFVGCLRAAVRLDGERVLLPRLIVERIQKDALHRGAVRAFPLDGFRLRQLEVARERIKDMRDARRLA